MRSAKGFLPLILIALAALAWFYLSEPLSSQLARWIERRPVHGPEVGRIGQLEGEMKLIRDGEVKTWSSPLKDIVVLHSGDRVEMSSKSSAALSLTSQDEFVLAPLTAASIFSWNEKDPASAVYVNVLAGDVELKKAGIKGKAYIVREGRLYLPGQKVNQKPLALTVLKTAPLDMTLGDASETDIGEFDAEAALDENAPPKTDFQGEPETLSNEYIDEVINTRQGQLQKCWLSQVKDNPTVRGQMVVQFEIQRRGRVKSVRIADSSIDDEALKRCVTAVFERLNFRSFKGSEITLSYPIQFE